jgi:mono/diheme cytochrome c family protein
MKHIWIVFMVILVLAAGAVAFVWSGAYNVSARVPHLGITVWLLQTVRNRSISAHSKGLSVPPLNDRGYIELGLHHFHPMCRLCHGAPGYSREEFAQGLYPAPPDLVSGQVQGLKNSELYWIVDNGLKMTGMPAFGVTHSEKEMWAIVAFLRRLPKLNPQGYNDLLEAAGLSKEKDSNCDDTISK